MKEILAIIRMNKMNETKKALADAGVFSFTARKVIGRGQGRVEYHLMGSPSEGLAAALDSHSPGPKMIPKRMLSLVAPDDKAPLIVKTIIEANQAGHAGDGKVFVLPTTDAVRVRTAERGDAALYENA